ncbi:DUF2971 domain-containing protein [Rheinheimera soli]|uniref:DUF2971 domain-containing protein n=1 Tax=Rheinheimera soli TaxID=443616 RepID=A0ABU1W2S1_9GAMM|nr:DUF2971 domain-containing protein [Rheinheimera soli]MDR7122248.1 hypothetical protein [Rheinheimera soli]
MSFYKYTNINTAVLVLQNSSLRWSSPLLFNDLEECQFTPFTKEQHLKSHETYIQVLEGCARGCLVYNINKFSEITMRLIHVIALSMEKGTYDRKDYANVLANISGNPESDYRDFMNTALIRCFRVLCVTEKYDNSLMWAHYADQHYGCVFELEDLYDKEPRLLRKGYVRYHENVEPRSNPLDMLLYGETDEVRDLMIRDVAFSKRTFWSYEQEYRFMFSETFGEITTKIDMQNNTKDIIVNKQSDQLFTDVNFSKKSLKSIIFGVRCMSKDIQKIVDILENSDYQCDLYQMKMRDGCLFKEELSLQNFQISVEAVQKQT